MNAAPEENRERLTRFQRFRGRFRHFCRGFNNWKSDHNIAFIYQPVLMTICLINIFYVPVMKGDSLKITLYFFFISMTLFLWIRIFVNCRGIFRQLRDLNDEDLAAEIRARNEDAIEMQARNEDAAAVEVQVGNEDAAVEVQVRNEDDAVEIQAQNRDVREEEAAADLFQNVENIAEPAAPAA